VDDPVKVEYRLFQLLVNAYGDERRTAVMLHWDGRTVRIAWNGGHVHERYGKLKPVLESSIRQLVADARDAATTTLNLGGLDEILPGRIGDGTHFVWGPKRIGYTKSPERHFVELAENLRLKVLQDEVSVGDDGNSRVQAQPKQTLRELVPLKRNGRPSPVPRRPRG